MISLVCCSLADVNYLLFIKLITFLVALSSVSQVFAFVVFLKGLV